MTDTEHPTENTVNGHDADVGEPIAEIAALDLEPAPGFRSRVRNAVSQRVGCRVKV